MGSKHDRYKETIKVYEKLGKKYIQEVAKVVPYGFKEFVEILLPRSLVLDVGCTGGRDSKRLAQKGFRVIGIDLVDEFLEEARQHVPEAEFVNMDLLKLEFPENYFDAIYACAVLLHLEKEDIPKALEGFRRVLKPNGKLYVAVKEGEGVEYKEDKISGGYKRTFTYFREDELKRFLEKAGFKVTFTRIYPDPLGRKDVNWLVAFGEKRHDKFRGSLKEAEGFKFEESFLQGRKLLELIEETVESKELEKLNRRQLRSLVIQKWKEVKKKERVKLNEKSERAVIKAITDAFFKLSRKEIQIPEKIRKAIEKKVNKNKKS